jgi:dinuclear metal center YbgI/SA1388 family protein
MKTTHTMSELVGYLDRYLRTREVSDSPRALNGLQVENSGRVTRMVGAVDACQASIDAAAARGADLLIVHHGLFWDGLMPLTGRLGRRVRTLVQHDVHPEVGNNAVLAQDLGLQEPEPFGRHEGTDVGVAGGLDLPLRDLLRLVEERLGVPPRAIAKGPERVRRVGIVSGGGSALIAEAHQRGVDTFITGEGPHHTFFDAEEWGINVVYAGHYATETVGVQALGEHIQERFGIPFEFFDHPTGL